MAFVLNQSKVHNHMGVRLYVCADIYVCVPLCMIYICIAHICLCAHVYVCTCVCMYICIHKYILRCVCTYLCACIYICTCVSMHIYLLKIWRVKHVLPYFFSSYWLNISFICSFILLLFIQRSVSLSTTPSTRSNSTKRDHPQVENHLFIPWSNKYLLLA